MSLRFIKNKKNGFTIFYKITTDTKFLQIPEIHSTHSYGKEPTENILGGRRFKKKKKKNYWKVANFKYVNFFTAT